MKSIKKKSILFFSFLLLFSITYSQDETRIWNEFILLWKNGQLTEDKIKPWEQLGDRIKPVFLGFLETIRSQASPEDWTVIPEIIKIDNRIQYIFPWSAGNTKVNYCFSFITENSEWYFQHMESIFIRLDKLTQFPVSEFPDISDSQKSWILEEKYWSFIVQKIYLPLAKEKGKDYALNLLLDGNGYCVEAKTWVPFTSPAKAFILYLCWEQSNLRGNKVTLESLTDTLSVIKLDALFFRLYTNTGHLKLIIPLEDYKQIFETIWQDRAKNAGWNLDISYSPDNKVTFKLTR
jgi:hypothetical protein